MRVRRRRESHCKASTLNGRETENVQFWEPEDTAGGETAEPKQVGKKATPRRSRRSKEQLTTTNGTRR